MEDREREVLWNSEDVGPHAGVPGMTRRQLASVRFALRELPLAGEEVREWRVERGVRGIVYLFASTRVIGERGAQALLRGHFLFAVGPLGAVRQLSPERPMMTFIERHRPGRGRRPWMLA